MNAEDRLKTLVKYRPASLLLSVRCGKKSYMRTARECVAAGFGDYTVQEDGVTVHVSKDGLRRIEGGLP